MAQEKFFFVRLGYVLGVFALVLACCTGSWGQMTTQGTVTVAVIDQSGASVQGAKLQLQDSATSEMREAETQQAGGYTFVALPAGTYKLTVSKTGFQSSVLDSVVVESSRVTDIKVTLKLGSAVEKVVVTDTSAPLLETTSSAIASTIDMKQIEELPLQGRDISALAFLTPGFTGTPGNGTWGGLPVIAQGNNIDGVLASTSRMKFAGNSQPGLEARLESIEEMTVQTGQSDLNQGLGTASMQVNFVTRRGSNDYHGRVYEDFRNTVLNANSWFNDAVGNPRNPIILNDFGGSVGGKVIKDKLFFFGSFAMSKQPGGYEIQGVPILSAQAQSGVFAYNLNDSAPFKGQTVNLFTQVAQPNGDPACVNGTCSGQSSVAPTVSNQLQIISKNIAGATVTPSGSDPNIATLSWAEHSPITRYYPSARVDYNFSQRLKLDFSYQETKINQPNASAPPLPGPDFAGQAGLNKSSNYITSIGLNWTITPSLINQFRGGYYYNAFWYGLGAKPIWAPPTDLPQVGWALGTSGQTFDLPVSTYYPIVNVVDNASWIHGLHSISLGFDFYREQDHYWNPPDGIPNVGLGLVNGDKARTDFENYFNGINAPVGDKGEAEALYATLVGRISSVTPIGSGFPYNVKTGKYATVPGLAYNLDELQKGWGLYAQDSFRVRKDLTFNYGLRWDFTGDDHDLTSAYHGASIAAMFGPSGVGNLFKPGTLTGDMNPAYTASSHQYAPWNVSPQPTIGLAWNPTYSEGMLGSLFGGKTVIRAGFDLKRFTEPYQYFWNNASNHGLAFFQYFSLQPVVGGGAGTFAPGSLTLGTTLNPSDPTQFTLSPAAYANSIPESTYTWNYFWGASGFDPHIKQPYVQEWNLGIQRQLGQNNVLEVRYVGHRSVHQWIQEDPNEVNIFENGFLKQFQAAQANLKACMANTACAANPSFANQGLPGQVALPIFDAAFACPPGGCPTNVTAGQDYTNGSFITDLSQGAAGALASQLAYPFGTVPYICNLVGSSLSPCTGFGYNSPGAYPLNFFQANPLGASFPGVTQSYQFAGGYGNYHALQIDFRQKQWHGMQFDVNYTFSHTLGLQPENYQGSAAAWLGSVNEFTIRNLKLNYGPTNFDLRHVIHASGTFDLPFGKGKMLLNKPGVVDKIVGGWNVGTILTWETGFPFQLFGGYNTFNDYGDGGFALNGVTASQLQNAVGVFQPTASQCNPAFPCTFKDTINPALRGSPSGNCNSFLTGVCQNTTPGKLGYNPWLYGPHVWNDDMALSKAIPFGERFKFTFQAEALNVFNHPNWGTPGGFVNGGNVGTSGPLGFTNVSTNNNGGARVLELRANITF